MYNVATIELVHHEMEEAEQIILQGREDNPQALIEEEWTQWIPDTGNTHTRQNTYLCTMALFWHMKALLGQALINQN
jgi:hypothetical protein